MSLSMDNPTYALLLKCGAILGVNLILKVNSIFVSNFSFTNRLHWLATIESHGSHFSIVRMPLVSSNPLTRRKLRRLWRKWNFNFSFLFQKIYGRTQLAVRALEKINYSWWIFIFQTGPGRYLWGEHPAYHYTVWILRSMKSSSKLRSHDFFSELH